MQPHILPTDLEDQLGGLLVDKWTCIVDPAGGGVRTGLVGEGEYGVGEDADAGFENILEAEGDLVTTADLVEGEGMGDQALLEALEVEVPTVPQ